MLNSFYDKFIFTNGLKFRHNNFFLGNVPFVICPVEVFAGLLRLEDIELNKKIYSVVKDSVKKNLVKQMSLDFGFKGEKMIDFFCEYFSASGWGTIKHIDLDLAKAEAIVSVQNSVFASAFVNAKKPVDHFLRGIFAGFFSRAFEKDVDCAEVHCSALGHKDCEFVVKPQNLFDLSNLEARSQIEFEL